MAQGRARFLRDIGMERAQEGRSRDFDVSQASRSRSIEQERKGVGSLLGSIVLGSIFGPAGIPIGTALGKLFGGAMTVDGKAAEDYKIGTDVGKFDLSEEYDIADVNRRLEAADKADVWSDVVDVGKSAALAFTLGGGTMEDPSNFSLTHFGGKKAAAEGMYGQGLFGNIDPMADVGSGAAGTLWGRFKGLTNPWDVSGSANVVGDVLGSPSIARPKLSQANISGIFDWTNTGGLR